MLSHKKVAVLPLGCPENRLDSAQLSEYFKENWYVDTNEIRMADAVVDVTQLELVLDEIILERPEDIFKTSLKRAYEICRTFDQALRMG